jgi:hypothetical protein
MIFPRAMNNTEKENLKQIKKSGLAYELKFDNSPWSGGYVANIPSIKETHSLNNKHYKFNNQILNQ